MPPRNSIPVPSEQSRQRANQRDPQHPWRSSLDLVWSYSRSQAFYGENIATSPSFVDRHWAGRRSDSETLTEEDSQEGYNSESEDWDDEEDLEVLADEDAGSADHHGYPDGGDLEWEGEQLPPNALARRRAKARDRRLSRLEDEEDEERGRSRSRSPKKLNDDTSRVSRTPHEGSHLNPSSIRWEPTEALDKAVRPSSPEAPSNPATESTPLLSRSRSNLLLARKTSDRLSRTGSRASMSTKSSVRIEELGKSTFLQSWFNTLNVLVGVGILTLPLAFSYAGWIGGIALFLICGALTNYTGKVLAHVMSQDPSLRTYADIGSHAFGPNARLVVSLFFCLELWAVSVALIILFGDSLYAIVGGWPPAAYKAIGFVIILPTVFLPLNLLSPISVIGIISTLTLFSVVLVDGTVKRTAPGSLWEAGPTSIGPDWSRVPLSFGLIMSGFSSHPVIPSLVKDMKDPRQFPKMLNLAYAAATVIYLGMGIVGYRMFGNDVTDEITRDLARTDGYPRVLNKMAIWLIVINPLAKFALATRPINTTLELLFGVEPSQTNVASKRKSISRRPSSQSAGLAEASADNPLADSAVSAKAAELTAGKSDRFKLTARIGLRILVTVLITANAIVLPGFEKVMAFLGAFLAFGTCVFGPLLVNLKLFHTTLSRTRIIIDVLILSISLVVALVGTLWAFLPDQK